jgi:hypothetical protein
VAVLPFKYSDSNAPTRTACAAYQGAVEALSAKPLSARAVSLRAALEVRSKSLAGPPASGTAVLHPDLTNPHSEVFVRRLSLAASHTIGVYGTAQRSKPYSGYHVDASLGNDSS